MENRNRENNDNRMDEHLPLPPLPPVAPRRQTGDSGYNEDLIHPEDVGDRND